MPKMQDRLIEIIATKYQLNQRRPEIIALSASEYSDEVKQTYQHLGGDLAEYPPRIGNYDISTEAFDIEFDEYLHFNRYRRITLTSPIYRMLPKFPIELYRKWCESGKKAEMKCLDAGSHGKRWSTPATDYQFGISNVPGNLSGSGSSRWKQRAFNDYRKDVLSLVTSCPLVRTSIYDKIGAYTFEQILNSPDYMDYATQIVAFVERRLPDK